MLTYSRRAAVHGVHLLDRCPDCRREVSSMRPGVARCQCGTDLGSTACQLARPDDLMITRLIDRRWRMSFEHDVRDCPPGVPTALAAETLIHCAAGRQAPRDTQAGP